MGVQILKTFGVALLNNFFSTGWRKLPRNSLDGAFSVVLGAAAFPALQRTNRNANNLTGLAISNTADMSFINQDNDFSLMIFENQSSS